MSLAIPSVLWTPSAVTRGMSLNCKGEASRWTPLGWRASDRSNITRWAAAGHGLRCRGNTWFIPYDTIQSRNRDRPHPASFPTKIPEQCLRLHGTSRAGIVLDPFLGLGASAVAAARLGLDFIGIEMDERYLKEAVNRVKDLGSSK